MSGGIRSKIRHYAEDGIGLEELRAFVGMLQTGEATKKDFAACGIELESVALRYGCANGWTGSSGRSAAELLRMVRECK